MSELSKDRFRGCLLGLAVGDAPGALLKFVKASALSSHREIYYADAAGYL